MAVQPGRARLVRRASILLIGAQVTLWGCLGVWARLAPVQIDELTGRESSAGLVVAFYYVAAAVGARLTGRIMDRSGRRPGLLLGHAALCVGGLMSFGAIRAGSSAGLLGATLVVGFGAAAALLGRTAMADLHPPERRGRAVGTLVLTGTAGAVGGPFLASALAGSAGPAAPWLAVAVLGAVGAACAWGLRPDPRDLAVGRAVTEGHTRPSSVILRTRPGVAAALAIGTSQAVMATFMAIVPVVLNRAHAGHGTVSGVVSVHLGAMFLFSPLIGAVLDRAGRRAGLLAGLAATGLGVGMCSFPGTTGWAGPGLFLVGVGWSAAYLGSTAMISDLSTPAERGRALGSIDLLASLSAGVGVLGGAALVEGAGMTGLGGVALILMAAPLALALLLREPAPGRWEAEPVR
jgi:MFS family permease